MNAWAVFGMIATLAATVAVLALVVWAIASIIQDIRDERRMEREIQRIDDEIFALVHERKIRSINLSSMTEWPDMSGSGNHARVGPFPGNPLQ